METTRAARRDAERLDGGEMRLLKAAVEATGEAILITDADVHQDGPKIVRKRFEDTPELTDTLREWFLSKAIQLCVKL